MHRRYLLTYVLFLLPVLALLGLNRQYLMHAGEFLTLEEIVTRQQTDRHFCIYGTALHSDTIPYKVEAYRARKPVAAVLGSSLMMSFRERYFREPFYSLSQTMDGPVNARLLLPYVLGVHKPTILFLGVDFWWFRGDVQPYQRSRLSLHTQRFTLDKLLRPFTWILQGKVSLTDYLRIALRGTDPAEPCGIGVFAREDRQGFGPDGSYYSMSILRGRDHGQASPQFARQLEDLDQSRGHYVHGTDINRQLIEGFARLIKETRAAGVTVVPFFPALSPKIYAELQRHPEEFRYIPLVMTALRERGIEVVNFLDPQSIGTSDCEFIDGDHMGEIAAARLLRAIDTGSTDPLVHAVIDRSAIDATIAHYEGFAMVPDSRISSEPETDFLQLGCRKKVK